MGVRILTEPRAGLSVFYCSTSDWAFGPVVYGWDARDGDTEEARASDDADSEEVAECFLRWLKEDARSYEATVLESLWAEFAERLRQVGFQALEEEVLLPRV